MGARNVVGAGLAGVLLVGALSVVAESPARAQGPTLDERIRQGLEARGITPLDPGPPVDRDVSILGRALFFDRILSGNLDTACSTCHLPTLGSGDDLSLSIGVGGVGLGSERELGTAPDFIARNATELFNRGAPEWRTQFWDSRIEMVDDVLTIHDGTVVPVEITTPLEAQAMFPVLSREEMRGFEGENAIADLPDEDVDGIWALLMDRLLGFTAYRDLFARAFPTVPFEDLTFAHAAIAMADWEIDALTFLDSPFDQYLAGDDEALTMAQKRGAFVFLGVSNCGLCHNGPLLTNQQHYNLGVPQLGPGKGAWAPHDGGRFLINGFLNDRHAFRVPPLRNVEITGPWMHNGAYVTLRDAVIQHLRATTALLNYDVTQLRPELQSTVLNSPADLDLILATLDLPAEAPLSAPMLDDLIEFLKSMTSPTALDLDFTIPFSVPSGLPVDGR